MNLIEDFLSISSPSQRRAWILGHREEGERILQGLKTASAGFYHSDPERALEIALLALEAAEALDRPELQGLAHWIVANAFVMLEQHGDAIPHYRKAWALLEENQKTRETGQMLVGMVFALTYTGRFDEAQQVANQARAQLMQDGDTYRLGLLAMNEGVLFDLMESYDESLAAYQRAKTLFHSISDYFNLARTEVNLGIIYRNIWRLEDAEKAFLHAAAAFKRVGATSEQGRVILNLAVLRAKQGRYRSALTTFDEARDIFRTLQMPVQLAETALHESQLFLSLHLYPEAAAGAEQALAIMQAQDQKIEAALAAETLGKAFIGLGDLARARHALTQALEQYVHLGLQRGAQRVRLALAQLDHAQDKDDQAFDEATAILQLGNEQTSFEILARANLLAGRIALRRQQPTLAQSFFSQAQLLGRQLGDHDVLLLAVDGLGQVALMEDDIALAQQLQQEALAYLRRQLLRIPGSAYRAAYLGDKTPLLQRAIHTALLMDDIDGALDIMALSQAWLSPVDLLRPPDNPQQQARWQATANQLQQLKQAWYWRTGAAPFFDEEEEERGKGVTKREDIHALEARIDFLWRRLNRLSDSDSTRSRQVVASPGWDIPPDGSLRLIYYPVGGTIWGVAVNSRGAKTARPLGNEQTLRALLRRWQGHLQQVQGVDRAYLHAHHTLFLRAAQRILSLFYEALVAPFAPWLQGQAILEFAPYDFLLAAPFPIFFHDHRYLVERHRVRFLAGWHHPNRETKTRGDRAISLVGANNMAGRLPYVDYEAQMVSSVVANPVTLSGTQLTVGSVRALLQQARFVHLATHAQFRQDNPLFSWLEMADGRLTAHDLAGLRLHADLVVLSACETARSHGDMRGLAEAFLAAGARALIVSQWRVDDPFTSHFMQTLYSNPLLFRHPDEALVQTMRKLVAMEPRRHPFFWAPFVFVQGV